MTVLLFTVEFIDWDYKRFAEASAELRKEPGKYFAKVSIGFVDRPTTFVDNSGKIFLWHLPGLLLPPRVVRSAVPAQNPMFLLTLQSGTVKQKH